ncbi:MAG TPA: hypothetical protein VKP67_27575 [Xanthobacteraceae bacterium]|nr:hypothetical protein [Xanthobacteraceae bacterium]
MNKNGNENRRDDAMSIRDERRRERQLRQAARRRELQAATKTQRAVGDEFEVATETAGTLEPAANEEAKIEMVATEPREALWVGYCNFALINRYISKWTFLDMSTRI